MINDIDPFVVWNIMGLILVSGLLLSIILIVQRSQKRLLVEANERHQQVLKVQEDERLRIAADIHDDLVAQIHRLRLSHYKAVEKEKLDDQLLQLLSSARNVSHQLSPPMPETLPLHDLIEEYIASLNRTLSLCFRKDIRVDIRMHTDIKMHLFRIVQELITNTYKHAKANKMELLLRVSDSSLCLLVRDDGIGFLPPAKTGLGMQNIELRSKQIQAQYKFKSQNGTTFILVLPLNAQQK